MDEVEVAEEVAEGADGEAGEWPVAPGTTALSVPVTEADALVSGWRARYDTAARHGGSAHLTVLFPFLDRHMVDATARTALTELFAAHPPFALELARCARFPGVLYLVPEPMAPLRALTRAVTDRWPEHPPYGGLFGDLDPHLTVANSGGEAVHTAIEKDLAPRLPLTARVRTVDLVVHDGTRWRPWLSFPLGAGSPDAPRAGTGTGGAAASAP
ncbi:2'-5' RNA ligase family protein [Streptomyces iconiensis]|uniref:2'-5' RNA ligase family protein n=1 Tax=Streptomyces iconiensis TaxID=1384038 RepID=A0ABT7A923_9ACTN|nr:2'-5' RNA ligase family protein [Streptomyces iconiensis]MDJ1137113.1 2'-5' RNA ligase family protein [Streptomyces iconiensis]